MAEGRAGLLRRFHAEAVRHFGSLRGAFSVMNSDAFRADDPSSAVVTPQELRNGLEMMGMQEWADALVAELDRDGNGAVDLKELLELERTGAVRVVLPTTRPHGSPVRRRPGSRPRSSPAARRRGQHWNPLGQNGFSVEGWDRRSGSPPRREYDTLRRDERGCKAKGCWYCWRGDVAGCRRVQALIDRSVERNTLSPLPVADAEPIVPPRPKVKARPPSPNPGPLSPSMAPRRPPKAWPGGQVPADSPPMNVSQAWNLYFPTSPLRADDGGTPEVVKAPYLPPEDPQAMLDRERANLHALAADFYRRHGRAPALGSGLGAGGPDGWRRTAAAERARQVLEGAPGALTQEQQQRQWWASQPDPSAHSIAPSVHLRRSAGDPADQGPSVEQWAPWAGA